MVVIGDVIVITGEVAATLAQVGWGPAGEYLVLPVGAISSLRVPHSQLPVAGLEIDEGDRLGGEGGAGQESENQGGDGAGWKPTQPDASPLAVEMKNLTH